MQHLKTIEYDGTFYGFLSSVFNAFENKNYLVTFSKNQAKLGPLFSSKIAIATNTKNAQLVWNALQKLNSGISKRIYFSFLSETENIEQLLFAYIKHLFNKNNSEEPVNIVLLIEKLNELTQKVEAEKHRMQAFAIFQLKSNTQNEAVIIKPKYNVLPLLSRHIKQHLKTNQWQLFDARRKYTMAYDFGNLQLIKAKPSIKQAV